MIYTVQLKGQITIEAESETQALDRASEVIEQVEDSEHKYDAYILLDTRKDKIWTKKDKE